MPWAAVNRAVGARVGRCIKVRHARPEPGINGYYLKQFTDNKLNGHELSDTKEQVLSVGPGLVYHFSKHDHLFANVYWETAAENRTEGSRVNLRSMHHFH